MSEQASMMPRIGDQAPDFTAVTTQGQIQFHSWKSGSWALLFSHPADFTPVCTTELSELARRNDEFMKRKVKLIGLSIDSVHSHLAWRENIREKMGVTIPYPLIADLDMAVAKKYGMIHPGEGSTVTVRAVFLIDPKNHIRAIVYYPLNCGRNVDELVRLVDAIQTADANGVACPVNWKPGEKVIVPPPKTEQEVSDRKGKKEWEQVDFYLAKRAL
jgi:peroxiredoxin (alkyl hydroperoxide reductase subunit C)